MKQYTINGKTYTQRILVLGQIKQLTEALRDVAIPAEAGIGQVAGLLAERLPGCAAVVLQPEGVAHRDKDIESLEAEFAEHLDIVTADEIIDDFFDLTPAHTIAKLMGRIRGLFAMSQVGAIGSMTSSSSSVEETSPSETESSGDSP